MGIISYYGSNSFNKLVKKLIHSIDEMLVFPTVTSRGTEKFPPQAIDSIIKDNPQAKEMLSSEINSPASEVFWRLPQKAESTP